MKVKEVEEYISNCDFKQIILSDKIKGEYNKINVRPIMVKTKQMYQIAGFKDNKVFHKNIESDDLISQLNVGNFNQILVEEFGKSIYFNRAKVEYKITEKANNLNKENLSLSHNKNKQYLLNEGDNIPAMIELGIFTKDNKIVRSMYDKFKQINRFIEIVDDAFKTYNKKEITILDFGCGKSYLTFLIYHYFVNIKKVKAKIIGYDIKKDVVNACNKIAKKYDCKGLEFIVSDVSKDQLFNGKIDMVISLHACDTATDYALNFAIKNAAKYIFSVPCCQHEVNLSIKKGGDFDILLQDGLYKERFSALLTDSVRTNLLRAYGYSVDVLEFVDFAHLPKNIMLRAVKNKQDIDKNAIKNIEAIKEKYKFNQTLYNLLTK